MKSYRDLTGPDASRVAEQVDAQARRLAACMAAVRHVVAVVSGKGGVGKSAVTVNLAVALAADGAAVGLLDADLNGPSAAQMTGVRQQRPQAGPDGIAPAVGPLGLRVMSMDLLLPDDGGPVSWDAPSQQHAYAWRGLVEAAAFREFAADTAWGALDVLLVDLPPGTDRLPTLADVLPQTAGVIVVTLPSGVSQLVVGRSIAMAQAMPALPVIGVVENMSGYVCPHCGREERLFPDAGTAERAAAQDVPFLGRIPFDPRLAAAADDGVPFAVRHPDAPAAHAFARVAAAVRAFLDALPGDAAPAPAPTAAPHTNPARGRS